LFQLELDMKRSSRGGDENVSASAETLKNEIGGLAVEALETDFVKT
jgi:hypothetical protein